MEREREREERKERESRLLCVGQAASLVSRVKEDKKKRDCSACRQMNVVQSSRRLAGLLPDRCKVALSPCMH